MARAFRPSRTLLLAALAATAACSKTSPAGSGGAGHAPPPTVSADDIRFERTEKTKDGRRHTVLTAASAAPGPRGTHVFVNPSVEVELGDAGRAFHLAAPKASFTMPNQQPRDGLFSAEPGRPVVLTLTETEGGQVLERLRVFFDESARFDLESDEIRTDGPVQVTGPDLDFRGRGLVLVWNRAKQRVESLEITHGEILRWHAPAKKAPLKEGDKDAKADGAAPKPEAQAEAKPESKPEAQADAKPGAKPENPPYQLSLQGQVRAVLGAPQPGDRVEMEAERVDGCFALEAAKAQAPKRPAPAPKAGDPPTVQPVFAKNPDREGGDLRSSAVISSAAMSAARLSDAAPQTFAAPDERSLFKPGTSDLTLTWSGPLKLVPAAADAPVGRMELRGSEQKPVVLRDGNGGAIAALALTYQQSDGRVQASGNAERPIVIQAPGRGTLSGRNLDLEPGAGRARLTGPGRLEAGGALIGAAKPADPKAAAAKPGETPAPPPAPLRAAYQEALEATFEPSQSGTPKLGVLKSLALRGQVQAAQDDFVLTCGTLELPMDPPTAKLPARPREVQAGGGVMVRLRDPKQGEVQVEAPSLRLALDNAGAQTVPTALSARGTAEAPVKVTKTDDALQCEDLAVDFTRPAKAGERPAVAAIRASGAVSARTNLNGRAASILAENMALDPVAGSLSLSGQQPATVQSPDFSLSAREIRVSGAVPGDVSAPAAQGKPPASAARSIEIPGPGNLTLRFGDPKAPRDLAVAWQGGMRFDDAAGTGRFERGVQVEGRGPGTATALSAPEALDLWVGQRDAKGERQLRALTAHGGGEPVVLSATEGDQDGALLHRLRMEGPRIEVLEDPATRSAGQVRIPGAGLLQAENHRAAAADGPALPVTGRGVTLFRWKKSMVFTLKGEAQLLDDVEVRHRPFKEGSTDLAEADSAQLDCQQLLAEFDGLGDLANLAPGGKPAAPTAKPGAKPAPKADEARIRSLALDHGVTFRQPGRKITCDHLRYAAAGETLLLSADAPRLVEIEEGAGVNTSARLARFDLRRQQAEILEGAGR